MPVSIFTFRRTRDEGAWRRGGRVRKEERDDAFRINKVTVWMQYTSLPLTDKAVREKAL